MSWTLSQFITNFGNILNDDTNDFSAAYSRNNLSRSDHFNFITVFQQCMCNIL